MNKKNKLLTIVRDGNSTTFTVAGEPFLLDVLRNNGIPVAAACSGDGRCGQCRVLVCGEVTPPDEREREMLGGCSTDENGCTLRLACRVRLAGDCNVWIDTEPSQHKLKKQLHELFDWPNYEIKQFAYEIQKLSKDQLFIQGIISKKEYGHLPVGTYGWSGAYGSHFWVDPVNRVTAVYMKNSRFDGGAGNRSAKAFEVAVFDALEG